MQNAAVTLVDKLIYPENKPPLRYDDDASATPTAAQTLTQEFNLNWADPLIDRQIPATDEMIFLFKDPLRSVIFFKANQSSTNFVYQIRNPVDGTFAFNIATLAAKCCNGYWLPGDRATPIAGYAPHGPVLYPADCDGKSGYWCDFDGARSSKLQIVLDDATNVAGGCVDWFLWTGSNWIWYAADEFSDAQDTYTMSADPPLGGAYMAAVITAVGTSATVVTNYNLSSLTGAATWCHIACPQIDQLLPMIQGYRIVAASLKWQNLSPALDESGKLTAVTVAPGLPWSNIATGASRLSGLQGYKPMQAKYGYYGFMRPTATQLEWQYGITTSALASSTQTNSRYKVNPEAPYLAVAMSIANTNARNTAITVTHMIEYMTNSKAQEVRLPDAYAENNLVWDDAIRLLARTDNHHRADITLEEVFMIYNAKSGKKPKTM